MKTLSPDRFVSRIRFFCDLYGRKLNDEALLEFYRVLAPHLDDATFEEIATILLEESEYFPVPATWLKLARSRTTDRASAVWKELTDFALSATYDRDRAAIARTRFSPEILEIVRSVTGGGGIAALSRSTEAELDRYARAFKESYSGEVVNLQLSLAAGGKEG